MNKRNITIVVMILSVIAAIGYHRIQYTKANIQLVISYFATQNVEPYTYTDAFDYSKPVKVFHANGL